jgi:hypothetical protein
MTGWVALVLVVVGLLAVRQIAKEHREQRAWVRTPLEQKRAAWKR